MPGQPPKAAEPGIPDRRDGGFAGSLLAFAEDLREEGVAVGTSEILDTFGVLEHVPWSEHEDFKQAIASTLAKSPEDRRVFDLVFDRFFFRAAEAEAARTRQWREVGLGAQILKDLGVRSIRLLSSSKHNYVGLAGFGIEITETEALEG